MFQSIKLSSIKIALLSLLFIFCPLSLKAQDIKHVAVTAIVEHPALEACYRGIVDYLQENGYQKNENLKITFETAQGNPAIAVQIAQKLAGEKPSVIVPISTPSAQAVASNIQDTPIVFSAVTDPIRAGLVKSLTQPGHMITGVSDSAPIDLHLKLIRDLMPTAKKIGVITNPGEVNSVVILEELRKFAPEFGFTLVESVAPKSSEVMFATQRLVGNVDAIYVPSDNTIVSALEAIIQIGIKAQLPVFSGDTDSVERGTIAAVGFDYYDVGKQTGKIVARVLSGESPAHIDIETVKKTNFYLNLKAAQAMGLPISDIMKSKAQKIIK